MLKEEDSGEERGEREREKGRIRERTIKSPFADRYFKEDKPFD
jgi:hypothetical protein